MQQSTLTSHLDAGFGLGLRTAHYPAFLGERQPVDWLEIITDNYLVDGGKPLVLLDQIRRDYPVVMHGVAMSIGEAGGVDAAYLQRVKHLADRVQPMWISDHLCWSGRGNERLHDLYPMPYTDEAARHVIAQIARVQDVLQRRFVIENVSSYIAFGQSACSEWEFLSYVAAQADCLLLLDVNNVYVSATNHGFDPLDYLAGLPADRIQQIHLAGHSNEGGQIIDTHDHPVAPAVWALYREACHRFGRVPAMIERDAHIPPLPELLDELATARAIASTVVAPGASPVALPASPPPQPTHWRCGPDAAVHPVERDLAGLHDSQASIVDYVLERDETQRAVALIAAHSGATGTGLLIYRNAYAARLAETLADSYERVARYMGADTFERHARAFASQRVPASRSLGHYGAGFADFLGALYPANRELAELAQLDWDLRCCFDAGDWPAMTAATAAADTDGEWLQRSRVLHPTVCLRQITHNVLPIWHALDDDTDVPAAERLSAPLLLAVWRRGLQPHFRTFDGAEAAFMRALESGASISAAAESPLDDAVIAPEALAGWLRRWWDEGLLAASVCQAEATIG